MIDQKTLQAAITALKINVPVMRAEKAKDGTIKLWLYGGDGKPVTYKPKAPTKPAARKTTTQRTTANKETK